MSMRVVVAVLVAASTTVIAGCGGSTPESETAETQSAPAADASHEGHTGAGRVFFVSPKAGETVTNPVQFEFGSEQVTIAAVPEGEVAKVRPGIAHYHLGIDTGCTPVGEVIPRGVPTWIHFGTGSNTLEYPSPTTGSHSFTLQAGDDQHRAIEGMCETIQVNIAE